MNQVIVEIYIVINFFIKVNEYKVRFVFGNVVGFFCQGCLVYVVIYGDGILKMIMEKVFEVNFVDYCELGKGQCDDFIGCSIYWCGY